MPSPARRSPTPLASDLALVALAVALRLRLALEPCDDAFIVLTVVRNLLGGGGAHLVADGGDAVLSTWLWPALISLPAALGVDPVVALRGLGLGAEIALVLVVRRLAGSLSGSIAAGTLAAAALITHPVLLLPSHWGMETALVVALVGGGFLALERKRVGWVAVCAALLPWARLDGVLAAGVLLAAARVAAPGRGPASGRKLLAGALGAVAVFPLHRVLFGVWLPGSVTAKAAVPVADWAAGAAAVAAEFGQATLGRSAYWLVEPSVHLVLIPLAALGVVRAFRDPELAKRLAPLALWGGGYVLAFVASGSAYARNFPWYFAPPLLPLVVLAAAGAGRGLGELERRLGRGAPALVAAVALGLGLVAGPGLEAAFARVRGSFTAWRERSYAAAALWLGRNGPARSIASNEIGTLAYFSPPGTEIVDLFGIARPPETASVPWLELILERRPDAVATRADFRYRRELEQEAPGAYVWVRAGALDLGLRPGLAERLEPHSAELERWFGSLRLDRDPRRRLD